MLSARIMRRLALVAAAGALTIATSQARTFIPTSPQPEPQASAASEGPVTRPVRQAVKKLAAADLASCHKVRRKLWVAGEGWVIRGVSVCS